MIISGLKGTSSMLLPIKPFSMRAVAIIRLHGAGKFAGKNDREKNWEPEEMADERRPSYWFPHRRTGIYFPKGQDGVMEDIPTDAAEIHPTFWLRSADERIDHKAHTDDFTFYNSD
ncbi:hypothetical protein F511_16239 [Dorcoceras hygrometricum]|uniref:Uncharacterized protein n=1 Tax=Dorcoceras hygrometricum TaxID=472368 RepID=A0A2Z7BGF8_9LAMI|nr:hypothetical protein F511_16239 [Dorcoceras hygrometricum]